MMDGKPEDSSARATLDDLMRVEGQAELIGGRIVSSPPFGYYPGRIIGRILLRLDDHARTIRRGAVYTATVGYAVPELASGRESFSPDASFYGGPLPENPMGFLPGPPTLAVEVRSESDVGPAAEAAMAAKRADYFEAGTLVVWDVDPVAKVIRSHRAGDPEHPAVFHLGDEADAEPAVPGWRVAVDRLFA